MLILTFYRIDYKDSWVDGALDGEVALAGGGCTLTMWMERPNLLFNNCTQFVESVLMREAFRASRTAR